jgi:PAS domain S-box-containing protein
MTEDKKSLSAASLRLLAEERVQEIIAGGEASSPEEDFLGSPEKIMRTLHELQVHQIELEMQNEELRRTQQELDGLRNRYFDLYNLAPVGYVTISEQGLILEANLTAANLLGVARGALVRQPLSRYILGKDQDLYYQHRRVLFMTGAPQACELRMCRADGSQFWARLEATTAQDADGRAVRRVVLSDISERKRAEDRLRRNLEEKEVLLREVHHRVNNNLTTIIGLIGLQKDELSDPAVTAEFSELSGRIRSMSLVHELLYQSETKSRIDLQGYLENLVDHMDGAYNSRAAVRMSIAAAGVEMDLDNAIPCGLIVNELITNAFKHAFPEGQPRPGEQECEIAVTAGWDSSAYTLMVSDNGVGLPADLDWTTTQSLGLQLVTMLGAHQLNGQIELDRSKGTRFCLIFSPNDHGGGIDL